MKRLVVACVLVCSSFAFAITPEQQKKISEAQAKGCEVAKIYISKEAACSEEKAKMDAVDCANDEQRKASKYLEVNKACAAKVTAAAKAIGAKAKAEPKAETKTEAAHKAEPAKAPAK